jgi:hypothetical protein
MSEDQRAVLRLVVIMKMRRYRRLKARFWPVTRRYW